MNIKKVVIIVCIICLFTMSVISQNEHHLEICNDEDCCICALIRIAHIIMNVLIATVIVIIHYLNIRYVLSRINELEFVIKNKSLIFQKVQLNE